MSIFLSRESLQLLKSSATRLIGQDCTLCGVNSDDALVCNECERSLPWLRDRACVAPFEYRFPVDRLIQRFKYAADLATGRWLALQLARRVRDEPKPDLVVAP